MTRITLYVVQTFSDTDAGLVAEEPHECRSAAEAISKAELFAFSMADVVAWAKSGDPDTGFWSDDPVIPIKAGKTGDRCAGVAAVKLSADLANGKLREYRVESVSARSYLR